MAHMGTVYSQFEFQSETCMFNVSVNNMFNISSTRGHCKQYTVSVFEPVPRKAFQISKNKGT